MSKGKLTEADINQARPVTIRPMVVMMGGALLPYLAGSLLVMVLRRQDVLGRVSVEPEEFFLWIPWVLAGASLAILLWAVWMIRKDKLSWHEAGLDSSQLLMDMVWGLLSGVVLWFLLALIYYLVRLLPDSPLTSFPAAFPPLPAVVYLVLTAIGGEFAYRGYGLGQLRKRSGVLWALFVTSILTGATFWIGGWQGVIAWIAMGILLGLLVIWRRGSIVGSVMARIVATVLLWGIGSPLFILGLV